MQNLLRLIRSPRTLMPLLALLALIAWQVYPAAAADTGLVNYRALATAQPTTTLPGLSDEVINASGSITINLPSAGAQPSGRYYTIVNTGTGTITVAPNGSDTIDGANANVLITTQYTSRTFFTDGATLWSTTTRDKGLVYLTVDQMAAAASAYGISSTVFTAPNDGSLWRVIGVSERHGTASTTALTYSLEVAGVSTPVASGVQVMTPVSIGTAVPPDTTTNGVLTAATAVPTFGAGSALNLLFVGTPTSLAKANIVVVLQRAG